MKYGIGPYVVLLYVVAVFMLASRLHRNDENDLQFTATRFLPLNTRLQDGMVKRPSNLPLGAFHSIPGWESQLKDRYVRKEIPMGGAVLPADALAIPRLSTNALLVAVPLASANASVINAGAVVCVISAAGCTAPAALVEAVLCERIEAKAATSAPCYAMVEVSEKEAAEMSKQPKLEAVLRRPASWSVP